MQEDEPPSFFGEWLKRRRRSLDLTQAELAQRAGCTSFALRKIEAGERRPSKQLAGLLAAALQVPPEQADLFVRVARGELGCDRLPLLRQHGQAGAAPPMAPPAHHWPLRSAPLVGREHELAALGRLLHDPLCRLLTLIGPGGVGKTRLASEIAAQAEERFANGAWFVPLASVATPAAVVPAIAEVMGLLLRGHVDPRRQLLDALADTSALIVLDNVEHLPDAVELFAEILTHAPAVRLLATSRARLNLQSEYVFVTQGLPVPPPEQLHQALDYDAVRLFAQSAQRAGAHADLQGEELAAAVQICRLVEGMPLGIELAAAWTPLLSCQEIAAEIQRSLDFLTTSLRDLPERQRSLRAVFDHSWRLLATEEQTVLGRLSIFRGGFARDAATAVAGANLESLLALTSKSLIRRKERGRYDLHEVVRQYAFSHLAQTPACATTCACHSRFYLALLDGCEPVLRSSAQRQTLRGLVDEIDNLRAAWDWAVAHRTVDALAPAARALGCLFELSGWLEEGVTLLQAAIQATDDGDETLVARRLKGEALAQQALLLMRQGRFMPSLQRADTSLALLRPLADPDPMVRPLLFRSIILHMVGDLDGSQAAGEEALVCAQLAGDCWGEAYADFLLGHVKHLRGDHQEGYERLHRGLRRWRTLGDPHAIALGLNFSSPAAIHLGRYAEAEEALRESLRIGQELGDRWSIGTSLRFLGVAALAQGDVARAQSLLLQSLAVHRGVVIGWDIASSLLYLGETELALGDGASARGHFGEALAMAEEAHALPLIEAARSRLAELPSDIRDERAISARRNTD
ncbi:MAG TPA: tetratricopeptide repeat protein [Chloroflexaceae bacterium]|nr:tetratricopeptide repeat protein [Chloroflexaceae bacterium]